MPTQTSHVPAAERDFAGSVRRREFRYYWRRPGLLLLLGLGIGLADSVLNGLRQSVMNAPVRRPGDLLFPLLLVAFSYVLSHQRAC